jgi:hypothetical protein
MTKVRLIMHEAVPKCGSFEARFSDRMPPRHFRRLRLEQVGSKEALEEARKFARAMRNR